MSSADSHAVPVAGIDHNAGSLGISLSHVLDLFAVFGDDLNDRDVEFLSKLKVTVIMGRYAHDGAGTIVSQYIIGQPDGNLFAVQRVNRIATGEDAGLLLILHTVYSWNFMEESKMYFSTASLVSSVARLLARTCSGASTMKVAP